MKHIPELEQFLLCKTPDAWLSEALKQQDILLVDHANCEKKAATTAIQMMTRCIDKDDVLDKMSRLAREELRHFEQVVAIMRKRGIRYAGISASRYANALRQHIAPKDPQKLIDTLITGAFIEARSCERFEALAPLLDDELQKFYTSLLKSERRHFQDYLKLAIKYSDEDITERVAFFADIERELIESPDTEFRFHSGVYQSKSA